MTERILRRCDSLKVMEHIEVPIQAGDDEVLAHEAWLATNEGVTGSCGTHPPSSPTL
ncbi:MAG: hypothetical protein R3A10_01520 [Caldilineaceae bacterium]